MNVLYSFQYIVDEKSFIKKVSAVCIIILDDKVI